MQRLLAGSWAGVDADGEARANCDGEFGYLEYAMEGEDGEKGAMDSDSKVYTW